MAFDIHRTGFPVFGLKIRVPGGPRMGREIRPTVELKIVGSVLRFDTLKEVGQSGVLPHGPGKRKDRE